MKTLSTIQTLSRIAKIISNIIFVCAIVGLCLSAAGILTLAFGFEAFKLGDITIRGLLPEEASVSEGMLYAFLVQTIIGCIAAIILTKFSIHYFKRELADGTPFTFDGAKELQRLGILGAVLPLAADMLSSVLCAVLERTIPDVPAPATDVFGYVVIGVALIVMSCLCRYGAELQSEKETAATQAPAEAE